MIIRVGKSGPLRGVVHIPGDKSISHRYAMLAAVAEGDSLLVNYASGRDCRSTLDCLRGLGVDIKGSDAGIVIAGRGLRGLQEPETALDAGNSGTTMRLLSGILAGQPFASEISGDASLSMRPMERILRPLKLMGAEVEAAAGGLPPLRIRGGNLRAVRYSLPVASAQVKSCVLLAGLYADGPTAVEEPIPTRDHTEIALRHFGATVRSAGAWIEVEPQPRLAGRKLEIPGDLSGAAFFIVAALCAPGSQVLLPGVGLNLRRRALVDYLVQSGFDIAVENELEAAGELRGDLRVRYRAEPLEGALPPILGARTAALIDEVPVLGVLGTQVAGGLEVRNAGELRVKESDRIAALASNLQAMGAEAREIADGIVIRGAQSLHGADVASMGDHRIAMAFGIAGMIAEGETCIQGGECADVSFPGFWDSLARLGEIPQG